MKKAGILGGGQLGRMLLQAAANYPVETFVLENDEYCPAAHLCHHFTKGSITDFDTVYQFGKSLDALTIEIENVNVDALEKLESEGVHIYPKPNVLNTIKNKIYQKEFYKKWAIPSSPFVVTENREALNKYVDFLPAVHKVATGGYDGYGVQIITTKEDLIQGFESPAVLEKKVNIKKELSIIIAVNDAGERAVYPPAEMIFNPLLNILDYQLSPAELSEKILWKAEAIALKVVTTLQSPGIFAVELFITDEDTIFVNETAPRVHNSGHHTIEGNYSSQFDMLWRIMLDYPLGNPKPILPTALVNLLGAENENGVAEYKGIHELLQRENAFVHIYGKAETRPGRKMGHVTLLSPERQQLIFLANKIKQLIKVVAKK